MTSKILSRSLLVHLRRRLFSSCIAATSYQNVQLIPIHSQLGIFEQPTVAFGVSTIVLAVQKSDLEDDCKLGNTEEPQTSTIIEPTSTTIEPTSTTTASPENMNDYRLPRTVIPESYDLTLEPDLVTGLFEGKVVAKVNVEENISELKIHSKGLSIRTANIDGKLAKVDHLEKYELLVLTLPDNAEIPQGNHQITIEYRGNMTEGIVGLYRSDYIAEDGSRRALATSKFEPTYARQAFPCFDEPDMKATYTVHIQRPKEDYIALSNMPVVNEQDVDDKYKMVHFAPSVKMSTYLACFIVCDFKSLDSVIVPKIGPPIPLKVYATPAQVEKTKFALEVADAVITYFVDYFQISYPLPKLDLIAIPDFVSGAMEHWGLVTFRETALLYDETMSSTANKQRVATVVSHELAHSWFGNLVTMKWWNDLWLNEGFASYIQYKGIDNKYKDWEMLDQFLIDHLYSVLSLDATSASHPIIQTVITPDQITEIFDTITYNKGAAVLRMLETAVGENVFQTGVTAYLKEHAMGNAVTQDLLDKLQEQVPPELDVTEFMKTWTVQKGYPIITVIEEGNKYVLTQKRFLKNYEDNKDVPSPYKYKWTIPITYITDKDQTIDEVHWFKHDADRFEVEKPSGIKWIKFNHKQVGYYRVNYDNEQWKVLIDNIRNMNSISDKTHLLEESFSIAESGELQYDIPLGLTKYLVFERNYIPWSVAATKLEMLRKYLVDSSEYSNYLEYLKQTLTPAYNDLKWEEQPNEGHLQKRARVTILEMACSVGLTECLTEASRLFKNWLSDPKNNAVSQDLRPIVYKYGMVNAGTKEWEELLELYKKEIDANEKLNMLRGLASIKEPWLLKRLIELGKIVGEGQIIRGQDYFTMLQYISVNPVGTSIVWDYVRENWDDLVMRFTLNDRYLGRLIPAITKNFVTKIKLDEMTTFFEAKPEAGAGQAARDEALENVKNNIKWIGQNRKSVEDWIKLQMTPVPHTE